LTYFVRRSAAAVFCSVVGVGLFTGCFQAANGLPEWQAIPPRNCKIDAATSTGMVKNAQMDYGGCIEA